MRIGDITEGLHMKGGGRSGVGSNEVVWSPEDFINELLRLKKCNTIFWVWPCSIYSSPAFHVAICIKISEKQLMA
jgi:hypothetical protein